MRSAFHSRSTYRDHGRIPSQASAILSLRKPSSIEKPDSNSYSLARIAVLQIHLDLEAFDLVLEGADLAHEVGSLVGGDASSDDGPGDTASAAESHLGGDVDVGNVLVFAEKRQVEEDSERGGVSREDDQLADTTVEGLGGLVGALLKLACAKSVFVSYAVHTAI